MLFTDADTDTDIDNDNDNDNNILPNASGCLLIDGVDVSGMDRIPCFALAGQDSDLFRGKLHGTVGVIQRLLFILLSITNLGTVIIRVIIIILYPFLFSVSVRRTESGG